MKTATTDAFRTTASALRFAAGAFALPGRCRIRKCRRDGGCTGPLTRYDAATARFVAARPGDTVDEIAPLCCFAMEAAGRDCLAAAVERALARLSDVPGATFPEKTRALAARDWSRFCLPTQPAPSAEKPL